MITLIDKDKCTGCAACAQACPAGAINMKADREGFLTPVIDEKICTSCKKCITLCPADNPFREIVPKAVYGVRAKDEEVVFRSSSGGMFGTFASQIIESGGVVFGVGFDENLNVVHKGAKSIYELYELMGSKYVQSNVKDTYKEVKEYLANDVQVLFTGTPCQCAGLRKFLQKEYENLLIVDFVCHGVPSPELFRNYLQYMGKDDKIAKVCFRDKAVDKKKGHSISIEYENADDYRVPVIDDPYMLAFLQNISLRKSCYNCRFRKFRSSSDVTIGDFWGIDKTDSFLSEKDGVSLCTLNTEKGQSFFNSIADKTDFDLRTFDEALKENRSLVTSVSYNPLRDKYLKDMNKLNIKKLNDKYCSNSFFAKLRRFMAKR